MPAYSAELVLISLEEKAKQFDKDGAIKARVDKALILLNQFLKNYPFQKNPDSIDQLSAEDLFNPGQEYFFKWLEYKLMPLGRYNIGSTRVYRKICGQLEEFKEFLHTLTNPAISLTEKIDLPTKVIPGLGGGKLVIKKIISVYDDEMIPVFKTEHLEHFFSRIVGKTKLPPGYAQMSHGQKYQLLQENVRQRKGSNSLTDKWSSAYFARFLYTEYPLPAKPKTEELPAIQMDDLRKYGLLYSPVYHDEVIFLFSKLHESIGFPHIVKIRKEYPDILAIDENRELKKIEIETWASQFNHDPSGCDVIVCWENDVVDPPNDWPEIIQLRDYVS